MNANGTSSRPQPSAPSVAHARDAEPSLASALLAGLTEDDLQQLANRLAPYLPEPERNDGWLRGAEQIAAYIDCPASRVYALSSAGRIPIQRDGSALIARKSDLDAWVRSGGGKRP
jgi:hypothetical protein